MWENLEAITMDVPNINKKQKKRWQQQLLRVLGFPQTKHNWSTSHLHVHHPDNRLQLHIRRKKTMGGARSKTAPPFFGRGCEFSAF